MRSLLSDVKYWFSRAEKARTIAEAMRDPKAARTMFAIAEGYDRLAARAAQREGRDIYKPNWPPTPSAPGAEALRA